jgi:hypothetical protein
MSVYATIHSSNHAGLSTPSRAKHRLFPTTSRLSRKHSPLSDNHASFLRHAFGFHSALSTCFLWNPRIFLIPPPAPLWKTRGGFRGRAQYPGILSAKPSPPQKPAEVIAQTYLPVLAAIPPLSNILCHKQPKKWHTKPDLSPNYSVLSVVQFIV